MIDVKLGGESKAEEAQLMLEQAEADFKRMEALRGE